MSRLLDSRAWRLRCSRSPTRRRQTPSSSSSVAVGRTQVARFIMGKVCLTPGRAKFTFEEDGHYAYDGLWTSKGHYAVKDGAVTVLLESGIERDFQISMRSGALHMEDTAIRCEPALVSREARQQPLK